jgi:hypothetical protein
VITGVSVANVVNFDIAPRSLKDPVYCRFSVFKYRLVFPGRSARDLIQGVGKMASLMRRRAVTHWAASVSTRLDGPMFIFNLVNLAEFASSHSIAQLAVRAVELNRRWLKMKSIVYQKIFNTLWPVIVWFLHVVYKVMGGGQLSLKIPGY